jgi:hypothetical protein
MSEKQSAGDKESGAQHGATGRNNIFPKTRALDRYLKSRNDLSERQFRAVELLLRGSSDQEIATHLGVDRGTVFRWRKSVAFQREMVRQRHELFERSASEIQSLIGPALKILRTQLASDDPKTALRAAGTLLRFATPSRLAPAQVADVPDEQRQHVDDIFAYIDAPMPGQPGAPEDLPDESEE